MNSSYCPGCGLELKSDDHALDGCYNASYACRQLYDELSAVTLSLRDKDFIHQLVVDTYAAQHSGPNMKPIRTAFALIRLCLTFESGCTGKEVQRAHMVLGKINRQWPSFSPPIGKSTMTVLDVVQKVTKENYEESINAWGKSVWALWRTEHENIGKLVQVYLKV
jgi:hypothetical protein